MTRWRLKVKFYCISGVRSIDRRVNFLESCRKYGWSVEFIPAVIPPEVYEEFLIFKEVLLYRFDSRLVKGEVGCALSHLAIWNRLVRDDATHYCVFEDDATFIGAPSELAIVNGIDFQMFNKHSSCHDGSPFIGPKSSGLYGYVVSRDGAMRALGLIDTLSLPLDVFLLKNSLLFGGPLKVVVTKHLVDHEGVAPSEIGGLRIIASGRH